MGMATVEFEAVKKTKLYEKVVQQVQGMIADGLLKPGDRLPPERELAETFQVSRSSLRDAIRALEVMGLVEPRQGEGTIVRDLSASSLVSPLSAVLSQKRELVGELLDVRRIIEPPLAARAARHATPEDLARLKDILRRQKEKVERGELAVEEDSEFHYTIARAAKNSVVLKVLDVFMDLLRESRERSLQVGGRLQKSFAGHVRILSAICRRNAPAAEKAMRRHIEEVDISIDVDDTLCTGVESWAWYGLQPINRLTKPGGTLIVTSREQPETLIPMCHRKEFPYQLAIVKGIPSFSGLWVYKDDHTDVRILGAIARLLPELFGLESVQKAIMQEWKDPVKTSSAARSYEWIYTVTLRTEHGNPEDP